MLAFAYYLLKVTICSGLLFSYYYFALRNKRFHQYNRFYLLSVLIVSWLIPLLKIQFWQETTETEPVAIKLLTVVSSSDAFVEDSVRSGLFDWSADNIAILCFVLMSAALLVWLIVGLVKIARIIRCSPNETWNNIHFVFTTVKGAPFSFFKYIFWNRNIDLETTEGTHILQHELTHVTERHSADKLFVNIMLVFGWPNPFLWLIRKELDLIHEFIADQRAINDGDAAAFAAMLLRSTYPEHNFRLTNSFFHSPIKRRLIMLTTSKNPRYSYLRRLMILPLTCLVVIFFAFKAKDKNGINMPARFTENYTVVIDAGHGGDDGGAANENNVKEKDLTLALAEAIKENNVNSNINIILTREKDESLSPQERLAFLQNKKADLLISLHLKGTAPNTIVSKSIPEIALPHDSALYIHESRDLGSLLATNVETIYGEKAVIKQIKMNFRLLNSNKVCPSLVFEAGSMANEKSTTLLNSHESRKQLAEAVLKTINQYFSYKELGSSVNPISVDINKNIRKLQTKESIEKDEAKDRITIDLEKVKAAYTANEDVQVIASKIVLNKTDTPPFKREIIPLKGRDGERVLVVLDGKEMSWKEFDGKEIKPEQIKSINVLKGVSAKDKYGEKGKDGVIEIFTKAEITVKPNSSRKAAIEVAVTGYPAPPTLGLALQEPAYQRVFTRVENPPYYSKGMVAFAQFIEKNIQYPKEAIANKIEGAVTIQFIVDESGKLTTFKKLSDKGYGLEEEAIRLLKNSGDWSPGMQNGHKVPAEISQQIIFHLPGTKKNSDDNTITGIWEGGKMNLIWPVDNARVTTHFGKYSIPGSELTGRSDGIYLLTEVGTKVKAASAGIVTSVFDLGNIKAITIRHGDYFTTYSHLSSTAVSQGQSVQQGTPIGYAAANERGKGEVLFILTDKKAQFFDPEKMLAAR